MMKRTTGYALLMTGLAWACAVAPVRAEYLLKTGNVVFLGDSITAARGYTKIVELYSIMRYPQRKGSFYNAGQGGDTASGAVGRLERDVFSHQPAVVIAAFGINDIGWGTKADPEHRRKYLDGIREIVRQCQERKVVPVICSAAITAGDPDKAEKGYLQDMTDEGLALAASLGAHTVDLQRGMREIQRRVMAVNATEKPENQVSLHVKDGVHLSDLGQLAMGYALLKGLGAPSLVSEAVISLPPASPPGTEAVEPVLDSVSGCTLSGLRREGDGFVFVRRDEGLPMSLGVLSGLNYRYVPVPDGINRYLLRFRGLPEGKYDLLADGKVISTESAAALAGGVNLAGMTANGWEPGGIWNVQSDTVKELADARDKLSQAAVIRERFFGQAHPAENLAEQARQVNAALEQLMAATAAPRPCRMEIRPRRELSEPEGKKAE